MRDLNKIARECMEELDSIGIPFSIVLEWTINTRAKKRWGQCRKINGYYFININEDLLREDSSLAGLKNTIIHELLHTCPGCMAHNAMWNKWASKVHRELGYDIKRTSSAEEKGLSEELRERRATEEKERIARKIKYKATCNGCGSTGYYQRWTKFLANPGNYRCGRCGGKYTITGCNGWEVLGLNKLSA